MTDKNRPLALGTADPTAAPADGEKYDVIKADTDGNLWIRARSSNGPITGDNPDSDNINPANIIALDVQSFLAALDADGNFDRLRADGDDSDAVATETIGALKVLSRLYGFNGATFDRLLSGSNDSDAVAEDTMGVLKAAVTLLASNGTTLDRLRSGANNADAVAVEAAGILKNISALLGFNGTTLDRLRSGGNDSNNVVVDSAGILKVASVLMGLNNEGSVQLSRVVLAKTDQDTEAALTVPGAIEAACRLYALGSVGFDRLLSGGNNSDAVAEDTMGVLKAAVTLLASNGTTLDRLRSGGNDSDNVSTDSAGVLKVAAALFGLDGSTLDRIRSDSNNVSINNGSGNLQTIGFNYRHNNVSWDRWFTPHQFTILSSAERTASVNGSDTTTHAGHVGAYFLVNVSAVPGAAPSLTFKIQVLDDLSGNYFDLWTGDTVITAVGQYLYLVYPGVVTATDRYNAPLPERWRIQVIHGNANAVTYSVTGDGTGP